MFRASSAHLQEDIDLYKQHVVPSFPMLVLVACLYAARVRTDWSGKVVGGCLKTPTNRQATKNSHREWQYYMLHVYNCIVLKMSTWGSKHVEENIILWINYNWCIKLVINIYSNFYDCSLTIPSSCILCATSVKFTGTNFLNTETGTCV